MALLNKIVVCDDEDAIAHLVSMALGDAGYLCLRARDGEQAVFLAAVEQPDLLILDVMMPKLDGIGACKRLKADPLLSRIPILMLTSLASVEDRVKGLEAGADDYLPKPFDLRELNARVRALIRASRRERDRSPVTSLPGPAAFEAAVEDRLAKGEPFALLHVDLDGFDELVDERGFKEGEQLVASLGRTLAQAARGYTITHLGGDDFALVAPAKAAADLQAALVEAAAEVTAPVPGLALRVVTVDSSAAPNADGLARALAAARRRRA